VRSPPPRRAWTRGRYGLVACYPVHDSLSPTRRRRRAPFLSNTAGFIYVCGTATGHRIVRTRRLHLVEVQADRPVTDACEQTFREVLRALERRGREPARRILRAYQYVMTFSFLSFHQKRPASLPSSSFEG